MLDETIQAYVTWKEICKDFLALFFGLTYIKSRKKCVANGAFYHETEIIFETDVKERKKVEALIKMIELSNISEGSSVCEIAKDLIFVLFHQGSQSFK